MTFPSRLLAVLVCALALAGCKAKADESGDTAVTSPTAGASQSTGAKQDGDDAPPAEKTGGFDGKRAFSQVAKQVGFGPVGRLPMENIVAKIPGDKPGIIMLATHYDTKLMQKFVGADDAGSSTGVMLELARLLCPKHGRYQVWITFFDGEEAMKEWSDADSRYGSRQMAAKMAMSGDLPKIKAFLLADIVGTRPPRFKRESDSTKSLVDLVWGTAKKLGYGDVFLDDSLEVSDDHDPFLKRKVPCVDVIDLENYPGGNLYYWHTPEDTLDKVDAKSLAITGHVFLESVKQLQSK